MPYDLSVIDRAREQCTDPTVLGYLRSADLLLSHKIAKETSVFATTTTLACTTGVFGTLGDLLDNIQAGIQVFEITGSVDGVNFRTRLDIHEVFGPLPATPKAKKAVPSRMVTTLLWPIGLGLSVIRRMVMFLLWVLGIGLSVVALLHVGALAVDAFAPSWNAFWAQPRCALEDELRANSTLMQEEFKGEITKLKSMYSALEVEREKKFKDVLAQVAKESIEKFQGQSTAVLGEFKGQSTAVLGELEGKAEAMLGQINGGLQDTATQLTRMETAAQENLHETSRQVLENYKHIAASEKLTQKLQESVGALSVKVDELSEKDEWYAAKMEANEQRAMELGEKISELGRFFEYVFGADGKYTWITWAVIVLGWGALFNAVYVHLQMAVMRRQLIAGPPPAVEQAAPPARGRGRPALPRAQAPIPDPIPAPAPAGWSYDTVRKIVSDLANTMSDLAKIGYYLGLMLFVILVAYCAYHVKGFLVNSWTTFKSVPQQLQNTMETLPGKMTSAMTSAVGDAVTGLLNQTSGNAAKVMGFRG